MTFKHTSNEIQKELDKLQTVSIWIESKGYKTVRLSGFAPKELACHAVGSQFDGHGY